MSQNIAKSNITAGPYIKAIDRLIQVWTQLRGQLRVFLRVFLLTTDKIKC
jgi:hypothetical protein